MRTFAISILAALALPSAAAAKHQGPSFPNGNSAVNQYVEVVPTASGGKPSRNVHVSAGGGRSSTGGGSGGGPSAVAPSTSAALARSGAIGRQAAAIAQATAPSGVQGAAASTGSTGQASGSGNGASVPRTGQAAATGATGGTGAPALHTKSASSQVLAALSGSTTHGGLGVLLPVLLAVAVLAGAAIAVGRRRLRNPA
jgi:hypothetical protein